MINSFNLGKSLNEKRYKSTPIHSIKNSKLLLPTLYQMTHSNPFELSHRLNFVKSSSKRVKNQTQTPLNWNCTVIPIPLSLSLSLTGSFLGRLLPLRPLVVSQAVSGALRLKCLREKKATENLWGLFTIFETGIVGVLYRRAEKKGRRNIWSDDCSFCRMVQRTCSDTFYSTTGSHAERTSFSISPFSLSPH